MNDIPESFCIIRFPGEEKFHISNLHGKDDICKEGSYFIISPFGGSRKPLHIPFCGRRDAIRPEDIEIIREIIYSNDKNPEIAFSETDPTLEEHEAIVAKCVEMLKGIDIPSKVVLARTRTSTVDQFFIDKVVNELFSERRDACVFIFSTPQTGTWVGATPELLLSSDERGIHSMALAGTRVAGDQRPWDSKNIEEQAIVTDTILADFRELGLSPSACGPTTRQAGNVEHLCTSIDATTPDGRDTESTLRLADRLSPTPALAGYPREMAIDFIKENEKSPRECYGGYIGLVEDKRVRLYVNLRSARYCMRSGKVRGYAGGGITRHSIPREEVLETIEKFKWLDKLREC